jgi:hypothetical protein
MNEWLSKWLLYTYAHIDPHRIGSHDYGGWGVLPSASWRSRKTGRIIQSESEGLRLVGGGLWGRWCKGQGPRAQGPEALKFEGKRRWYPTSSQEDTSFPSASLVCAGSQWVGRYPLTLVRADWFLSSLLVPMLMSFTNVFTDTPRSNVSPVIQASVNTGKLQIKLMIRMSLIGKTHISRGHIQKS